MQILQNSDIWWRARCRWGRAGLSRRPMRLWICFMKTGKRKKYGNNNPFFSSCSKRNFFFRTRNRHYHPHHHLISANLYSSCEDYLGSWRLIQGSTSHNRWIRKILTKLKDNPILVWSRFQKFQIFQWNALIQGSGCQKPNILKIYGFYSLADIWLKWNALQNLLSTRQVWAEFHCLPFLINSQF